MLHRPRRSRARVQETQPLHRYYYVSVPRYKQYPEKLQRSTVLLQLAVRVLRAILQR